MPPENPPGRSTPRRLRPFALAGAALACAAALTVAAACSSGNDSSQKSTTTAAKAAKAAGAGSSSSAPASSAPTTSGTLQLQPALKDVPHRAYVPNGKSNTVSVIDPATMQVISTFPTGNEPQHIVPSWDLTTLWVLDNKGNTLIPIDPNTSTPGAPIKVDDPYNLYFTPDGSNAIVVAEKHKRLDYRDPHTMELRRSVDLPDCSGVNHLDYSGDGKYFLITCEFNGKLAKVDWANGTVLGMIDLPPGKMGMHAMPQDVRVGPDGHTFYVADMTNDGLHVVDGDSMKVTGFVPTGVGAHGLTPSRDGKSFYVANRGWNTTAGGPHGPGSISVFDPATNKVTANWPVPGGGSPDMGNLSTDGTELWLSGRYDSEVYVFDTTTGALKTRIPVGNGPHGMTYWPQPGHHSLGHTGNMR